MRYLMVFAIIACSPVGSLSDKASLGSPDDSGIDSGETPEKAHLTASFKTTFSVASREQIYSIAPAPQMGEGCFVVGDPYYDGFTGFVALVCRNDGDDVFLPDDATAYWTGSGENQALGCDVEVSETPSGDVVVGTSEFHDPTYEGRLLLWSLDVPSGVAADSALVDIVGAAYGDGNTGGYLGTTTIVHEGQLMTSQANATPYLLSASYGEGLSLEDLAPLVDGGSVYCGRNCGGFAGYGVSVGDDGTAWASFGGVLQHIDADGAPDWYAAADGDGTGEYTFPETDVTQWANTTRLNDGSPVLSVFSRESRADGEVTYARVFTPDGEETDDLSNVYGVTSGEVEGTGWVAYGVEGCDPSGAVDASGDCAFGYIHIDTDAGDSLDLSLPYEAGEFPSSGCLMTLESAGDGDEDGDGWLGWYCKDLTVGGMIEISVE